MTPAFGENGHLHELGLHAVQVGELPAEVAASAKAHLASCGVCAANFATLQSITNEPLPAMRFDRPQAAPPTVATAPSQAANTGSFTTRIVVATMAAAAAVLVIIPFQGPEVESHTPLPAIIIEPELDRFTAKGSDFRFTVYRQAGEAAEVLGSGAKVYAGDNLSFRIHNLESGYLAIAGVDASGEPWSAFPASGNGSVAISPAPAGQDLPTGVQLDNSLGTERLIAVYCPTALPWAALSDALKQPVPPPADSSSPLIPGCVHRELSLEKTEP